MTPREIRARFGVHRTIVGGGWLRLKPGKVTDDTEMCLCIARAVVEAGGWDLRGIADRFAAWLKGRPADVGATCRNGIREYMLNGRMETPYNEWDAGNGAVMRVAPVALATLGDPAMLSRCALEQARITHNHPLSDAACVAVGRMVHEAVLSASRDRLLAVARDLAGRHPEFVFDRYDGEASGYVVHTVRTVLYHFFSATSFEECLVGVVNRGGDADTTGSIAGAVAGAFYGPGAIPRRWLARLDGAVREEARALARALALLSPFAARAASASAPNDRVSGKGRMGCPR